MGKDNSSDRLSSIFDHLQLSKMDRRGFLRTTGKMAGLALGLTIANSIQSGNVGAAPKFNAYPFTLGVASGDPLPDGVVLWTRLAPDPLNGGGMPSHDVPVKWEVATDEGFHNVVRHGVEFARTSLGHSVHVEVSGLQPAHVYFYRFKTGSELSPVGRTKTLPAFGSEVSKLAFAFASCQQYEHGYYTAYNHMAKEDLDVVFHLGDYIYEYGPNEYVAEGGNVRTHNSPEITTLNDYRNRYALYRSDSDLQLAHAAFPWIVTMDDHEVENNFAGNVPEEGQPVEPFIRRRAAAYQAYYEHMPLRQSSLPHQSSMQLYRRFTYGNLVDFHVLDSRQYRDDQANDDGVKAPNAESKDPSRSILGTKQERWLLEGLGRSKAHWNVLAQQILFSQVDFTAGPGQSLYMDGWDGYAATRDRILDFVTKQSISNFVVLTGDWHSNWASDIKADFNNPDSPTIGVEFVGTSITSGGDGSDTTDETAKVLAENPHVKFFNDQRGYVRCLVTPDTWKADYRVLPYVKRPGAPISTRASFVVESEKAGLQMVGKKKAVLN